jgi:aminopeptidase
MRDPRCEALANVVVNYSTGVKDGDLVAIRSSTAAEPFMLALYEATLRAGGHPTIFAQLEGQQEAFFRAAGDAHIEHVSPLSEWVTDTFDVSIHVAAPHNSRETTNVDPELMTRQRRANAEQTKKAMDRMSSGDLRWMTMQFPTNALAAEAEMSLRKYEDFLYTACMVDQPDPIAAWKALAERNKHLEHALNGSEEVHLVGPGTDVRMSVAGRTWIAASGENNLPDGEVFTSPDEHSTEGTVTFDLPTLVGGREIRGIRLRFEGGKIVDASAEHGEEYLITTLDTDEGSRRLGEIGIGTNFNITRGTRSVLFDEKIGGTAHLAVGFSFPECGGTNSSSVHWDMICDLRQGGRIEVDGHTVMENSVLSPGIAAGKLAHGRN